MRGTPAVIPAVLLVGGLAIAGCVSDAPLELEKWDPGERAQVHIRLGLDYLKRNDTRTAGDEFNLALKADPRSDGAYHGLALMKIQQGVGEEALPLLRKALRLNPRNFAARNDLGVYLCSNGREEEGLRQLEMVVDDPLNTAPVGTYLGLGICNERKGLTDQARVYYRRALAIVPALPQALLPLARIEYGQRNYLSARAFIERYFGTGSSSPGALLLAARIELARGDPEQAMDYARRLWRQFPKSAEAEEAQRIQRMCR